MKSLTIDTYNTYAQVYDNEIAGFWQDFPSKIIDEFAKKVHGDILNIGCGTGRDGLLLEERKLTVTHIDASKTMVEMCQSRGLKAQLDDMLNLQFRADRFDGVWSYMTLVHLPKEQMNLGLDQISRVLKLGGWLMLGMQEGVGESYRESSEIHAPRWFALYTREEIETLLIQHGFTVHFFESYKPKSKTYLHFLCQKTLNRVD